MTRTVVAAMASAVVMFSLAGLYTGVLAREFIAAACWLMPYSLVLFGVYKFPYIALPLDFAWAIAKQGIGGVVIGLIHGKFNAEV